MFDVVRSWIDTHLSDEEALLFVAILIAFFAIIITMGAILAPLLTGIVLAYIMQGIITVLSRFQIPRWLALPVTFLLFLGGFIGFLFFIIPLVWRQLQSLVDGLPAMIASAQEVLDGLPDELFGIIPEQQVRIWIEMMGSEATGITQWLVSFSLSSLPVLVAVLVYVLLVPILVLFLLKDKEDIISWCLSFLPQERPLINKIGREMNQQMANYIRGKFIEFLIVGIASYLFFALIGLNYPILLGFLVGLSVIVPYVGMIAVTIPVVIIAYLQFGWTSEFFYVLLGYGIIQGVDGLVLVPLLFSEANNLHPIAIITSVLVFGSWWGLWGVFFAIPLATLVKAIINAWPSGVSE
ncbi:MAG: AI-2E family transporter [Candidatus Azotimanducaceae bacterium]|uniref:AI-2E family transporter n=1 Tax=OM182 bacterium TaxID=2510334 RepID=A0A520S2H0_9GAMM|nr:AI-2E family transporter [Gammaproteobacteria bacterium]OUV68261.1 MAG: AI-2E family transporter [Gammaproteobacteria bacterium TMED133]RZO76668.1 MAG: AI-2E family transporter [OM182 bacterium]